MILYPAIDLKGGRCVRLTEGRYDQVTVFNEDPVAQAQIFQTAGFTWLHVIDLDGAALGEPRHAGTIASILSTTNVPVQVGGGVRSMSSLAYWIEAGVTRVILGTAAVRDPSFVREAARAFPERVAVSIDARQGRVAVSAWAEQTDIDALDLARRMEDAGVACLVVTDIGRDGLKSGVNLQLTAAMADTVSIPVIASGGMKNVGDILALRAHTGHAIHGAILGRALYDGDIDAAAALKAAA